MRPESADASYLWDMLDAAKAVKEFVAGKSYEDYVDDRMLRSAVERNIEIIGEAAGKVSESFQQAHPDIPWRKVIAQRHVLAHQYGDIENELIWKVATEHIKELIDKIEPLLPPST